MPADPRHPSRRTFLISSGALAALAAIGLPDIPAGARPQGAATATALEPVTGAFPRWFAFRQSESLIVNRPSGGTYADWAAHFALAGGIEGKCLNEESLKVTSTNVDWFTQFKAQYPEKMVLLHYNGHARLPDKNFFSGHWLYRPGTTLTAALGDNSDGTDTELQLADDPASIYISTNDRGKNVPSSIVVAPYGTDGRPNFFRAEHMLVTSVVGSTVTVHRDQLGKGQQLQFPAGAYVAAHVMAGPVNGNPLWRYNFSSAAPLDAQGRLAGQVIAAQLGTHFNGGDLAAFDGLELDVLGFSLTGDEPCDCDCDRARDDGVIAGADTFGQGVIDYATALRAALGPDKIVMADGGATAHTDVSAFNGIELEGFPTIRGDADGNGIPDSIDFAGWTQYLSILEYYQATGYAPALNYPLFKFDLQQTIPDMSTATRCVRMTLAASVLSGLAFSFYQDPTKLPGYSGSATYENWDELVAGTAAQPQWLGQPSGDAVRLAESGTDLWANQGSQWPQSFVDQLVVSNGTHAHRVTGTPPRIVITQSSPATLTLPTVNLTSSDLYLTVGVQAQHLAAYSDAGVGQVMTVTVTDASGVQHVQTGYALETEFTTLRVYFRGLPVGTTTIQIMAQGPANWRLMKLHAYSEPDIRYRLFEGGLVIANPSSTDHTVNLGALLPGKSFKRLQGSPTQDPGTNDGSAVGATLTVPQQDAIFLATAS